MLQLLAIDAGGTSTRAMVIDVTGRCLGFGRGGRGNPVSDGAAAAAAAISTAAEGALRTAGLRGESIGRVTLAMAGGLSFAPTDWLPLGDIGVQAPVAVESDLLAMFCSGTADLDGYGVVAGTGATAVRVRRGENFCRLISVGETDFYAAFRTKFNFRIRPDSEPTRVPESIGNAREVSR